MQQVDLYKSDADAAYQGAPGAYSEEAARAMLGPSARLMPCATLEQTFEAVSDGRAQHAVVPIEDAHSGTVPQVYELLLSHDLLVSQELLINVDHVLVGCPGATRSNLRRVMSHPIALAQCADFFRQNRGLEAVTVFDTAGAVRMIVQAGDTTTAAIASHQAAALYDAQILAEHLQDHRDNWTRFLLLSSRSHAVQVDDAQKALVAFGLRHEPGALVAALRPIAEHGLSITKIEGRPSGSGPFDSPASLLAHSLPFEYRFIVEMAAPAGRTIPASVYDALRGTTAWLKPLGAFRV
jgi:prephenate dehydratase